MVITLKEAKQKMNPIHGVGNGPACYPFNGNDNVEAFRNAGIPYSRLHDTEKYFGCGEFVNIHCIFKNFDADVNDPASYSFTYTDEYIKHIYKAGTKPFYRLGETIELPPMSRIFPKYINPPKDYLKWAQICEHIIRHYTEGWADGFHYDMEYWEIWNEPDNQNMWTGTPEEYYEFYTVVSKHLKSCFPHLKIGGIATSGFYAAVRTDEETITDWFRTLIPFTENFFKYITREDKKAVLDFYTWHCYTDSVDEVTDTCHYVRNMLDRYGFTETESILDEWNYARDWDAAENRFRKTMMPAAMVAGSLAVMQDVGLDAAMYYDAEVSRIGFCGLFDPYDRSLQKPYFSLYAFNELKKLATQIETDAKNRDGLYSIAAADEKTCAVMIVNYKQDKEEITVDASKYGKCASIYLLDETHDLEEVAQIKSDDGKLKLTVDTNTVVLLKINS